MKIEKLYLLITVTYNYKKNDYDEGWMHTDSKDYSGSFNSSLSSGFLSGWHSRCVFKPKINDIFWKDNVEKIILYKYFVAEKTTYLTLCYLINPGVLQQLFIDQDSTQFRVYEGKNLLTNLICETFPDIEEMSKYYKQIKNDDPFDNTTIQKLMDNYKLLITTPNFDRSSLSKNNTNFIDTYLIIVPSLDEIKNLDADAENINEFLLRFENYVGRDITTKVCIPYYFQDFIETLHAGYIYDSREYLRVILCTKPNGEKNQIVIPDSIENLHDFDIKINVLKEIKKRLPELYAYKSDVTEYIESVSSKNIFKNYSTKFKKERIAYIQSKIEIDERVNSYKSDVINKLPYGLKEYYDTFLMKKVCYSIHPYSWSVLQHKNNQFDKLIRDIEHTLQNVTIKDTYINESLRDIISIESMWANLKLQKIIKMLTFVAIGLGLISIMATLYGNEIKELIKEVVKVLL